MKLPVLPFVLGGLSCLLAACATATGTRSAYSEHGAQKPGLATLPGTGQAEAAMARRDYGSAQRLYLDAATADPAHGAELRLRAAEAASAGGDPSAADHILASVVPETLDPTQRDRYRLLRAQAALTRGDSGGALRYLPADPGSSPLAEQLLRARGEALFRDGDTVGATEALVRREHYLDNDARLLDDNRELLWSALDSAPLDQRVFDRAGASDSVTRGWIELANLARRKAPLEFFDNWRKRYPGHPGESRLAASMMPVQPQAAQPPPAAPATPGTPAASFATVAARNGTVALLLPQSGPLQPLADAIRAGFESGSRPVADIVYDTSGQGFVSDAYRRAQMDNAGLLIGPLRKDDVAMLAQLGAPPLPVLALNYLDASHPAPPGFYQFGLAPEDEARAAAEDAVSRGLRRALVLVPSNERGVRVQAAFQQRLAELGGRVVDANRYSGEPKDWSDPVAQLLRFKVIEDRKALQELREKAQPGIDPQRRNDFDFIFIDARAGQARVIWPLFRYYHAERMPIYATAAVNEGPGDSDLAGIRFCDAPWALDGAGVWAPLHAEALANGRSLDNARLYALGHDAAQLATRIAQNSLRPGDSVPGATGMLSVDSSGAVHRQLSCAITTVGDPAPLGAPEAAAQAP